MEVDVTGPEGERFKMDSNSHDTLATRNSGQGQSLVLSLCGGTCWMMSIRYETEASSIISARNETTVYQVGS